MNEVLLEVQLAIVGDDRVCQRSSVDGRMRGWTPSAAAMAAVASVRDSPERSRRVRSTCVARSASPRLNQAGPP